MEIVKISGFNHLAINIKDLEDMLNEAREDRKRVQTRPQHYYYDGKVNTLKYFMGVYTNLIMPCKHLKWGNKACEKKRSGYVFCPYAHIGEPILKEMLDCKYYKPKKD